MMTWHGGWGWGDWLAMSLFMLAFWTLLVVGVVALARWAGAGRDRERGVPGEPPPDPQRILDERLARGELTEEEYQRRRDLLRAP